MRKTKEKQRNKENVAITSIATFSSAFKQFGKLVAGRGQSSLKWSLESTINARESNSFVRYPTKLNRFVGEVLLGKCVRFLIL